MRVLMCVCTGTRRYKCKDAPASLQTGRLKVGKYSLVWDNTESMFKSKPVHFSVYQIPLAS